MVLARLKSFRGKFPAQFWLMFWGMFISTVGSSMVWPFLMIYVSERLGLPLAVAASLMTINSSVALGSALLAGPIIDRAGRKWIMVASLFGLGAVYFLYSQANTYLLTALLMAGMGFFNPLYRVGGDAMVADLIPPEERPEAYALLRMANNLGISIGPAIGGFAAAASYGFAFLGAATGLTVYAVLIAVFARETLPGRTGSAAARKGAARPLIARVRDWAAAPRQMQPNDMPQPTPPRERLGGFGRVFADAPFRAFIVAFTLNQVATSIIWVLLSAHAKLNYGLPENLYGFIPMTNALMVVLLQTAVTRQTRRRAPLPVLALGSLLYGIAAASIALGRGFWGFWGSMVVMTVGELMLMPTASTYTANRAPADMRGRYMAVFGLTWYVAQGLGPLAGGLLSDTAGPSAPWLLGGLAGLVAALAFTALARAAARPTQEPGPLPGGGPLRRRPPAPPHRPA